MEIILKETINNLGREGEIVKVKPGYARNFLLPQQKAVLVTEENIALLETQKQEIAARLAQEQKETNKLISLLGDKVVTIEKRAGEENRLFGSVTNGDIAEALVAQGVPVNKKSVILKDPIKNIGEYSVSIKVGFQETANVTVQVVPEVVEA